MSEPRLTAAEKGELWRRLREPVLTFVALLTMLGANLALGWFHPFPAVWMLEGAIMIAMIAVVLLLSMEVLEEPALIRFFAILGFIWVAILFGMTLIDYSTR